MWVWYVDRFPWFGGRGGGEDGEFVTFENGGEGKQFYRKAAADGEREPSRTTGAHPVGESNLDYRKFMGVLGVCVRVRAYVCSHTCGVVRWKTGGERASEQRCLCDREHRDYSKSLFCEKTTQFCLFSLFINKWNWEREIERENERVITK